MRPWGQSLGRPGVFPGGGSAELDVRSSAIARGLARRSAEGDQRMLRWWKRLLSLWVALSMLIAPAGGLSQVAARGGGGPGLSVAQVLQAAAAAMGVLAVVPVRSAGAQTPPAPETWGLNAYGPARQQLDHQ